MTITTPQLQVPPQTAFPPAGTAHLSQVTQYEPNTPSMAGQDNAPRYPPVPWTTTVPARKGPLPSLLFAIPFPEPAPPFQKSKSTPLFLLYSMPRANYQKPAVLPNGKKEKEGIVKKVERKWQEEVADGEKIKAGEVQNPSTWQKFKGAVVRTATRVLNWLPDSNIETLGRLPPGKKIGLVTVVYPHEADEFLGAYGERQPGEIQNGLNEILSRTCRRAVIKTTVSAFLLPVTAAIDFFCVVPLFLFEINIAYFTLQINGARKVGTLSRANKAAKGLPSSSATKGLKARINRKSDNVTDIQPTSPPLPREDIQGEIFNIQKSRPGVFLPIVSHLYNLCSSNNLQAFPARAELPGFTPKQLNRSTVVELISAFKEWVPADVALRHNLNPVFVAKDLRRCMKKATKEYTSTLKQPTIN